MPGKPVIGWRELVDFPDWGVSGIEAKIDTGAKTSAVHVEDMELHRNGRVHFHLVVSRRKPFKHVLVRSDLVRTTRVRSSTGDVQQRVVVSTRVRIGQRLRRIEVSLVCRDKMLCRMLLGRSALRGFLIDANKRHLLHPDPKKAPTRSDP